jgi:hypothetical protein
LANTENGAELGVGNTFRHDNRFTQNNASVTATILFADGSSKRVAAGRCRPFTGTPLDRSSAIVKLLLDVDRHSNVIVKPLTGMPTDGEPERSAQLLDTLLKGMAARPEMRLQQES